MTEEKVTNGGSFLLYSTSPRSSSVYHRLPCQQVDAKSWAMVALLYPGIAPGRLAVSTVEDDRLVSKPSSRLEEKD